MRRTYAGSKRPDPAVATPAPTGAGPASWAPFAHSPGHTAYAAAKAGLEAMANSLRSELAHQGVGVGVFHPGWIDTPMVANKIAHHPAFNRLLDSLPGPLGRVSPVSDVADALVDGITRRSSKIIFPRVGWLLHLVRPALPTRLLSRTGRAAAPEIRRRFADTEASTTKA